MPAHRVPKKNQPVQALINRIHSSLNCAHFVTPHLVHSTDQGREVWNKTFNCRIPDARQGNSGCHRNVTASKQTCCIQGPAFTLQGHYESMRTLLPISLSLSVCLSFTLSSLIRTDVSIYVIFFPLSRSLRLSGAQSMGCEYIGSLYIIYTA